MALAILKMTGLTGKVLSPSILSGMIVRLKKKGYRFRVYLFTGLIAFFVFASFAFALGVVWYSKQITTLIVGKDFKAREIERCVLDGLISLDSNHRKYSLLGKQEYRSQFYKNAEQIRLDLARLENLELSEPEKKAWTSLKERFEVYVESASFSDRKNTAATEGVSDLPLAEVHQLMQLNQDRMNLRVAQMNQLEERTIHIGVYLATISLLAGGLLAFFLIRAITKPIDLLRKGIKEVAEGKFTHRVDLSTHDELGRLADDFNEMAYQLKKLDDMKSDFIAIVSHELKTPLTSMKEAVDLLLEEAVGPLRPKQRHLLDISAASTKKLAEFINDILNLTRMEGGLVSMHESRFDFHRLLEEKLATLRLQADKKEIVLSATYDPDPLPPLIGDPERLGQVLANLLNNAIHFTPRGGKISVQAEYMRKKVIPFRSKEDPGHGPPRQWLEVSISDTGRGIPKEEWKRVFGKFYQIERGTSRGKGSGLGLAITRYIVEGHGGTIRVGESSRKGTTIVFTLPQDRVRKKDDRKLEEAPLESVMGHPL